MQMYMKLVYNPSTDTAEMLPNLICKMYLDIVDKQNRILYPTQWANENSFFFSCYRSLNSMMNIFSKCQVFPWVENLQEAFATEWSMNLRKRSYNHQYITHIIQIREQHARLLDWVSRTTEGLCPVCKHSSQESEILLRGFGPINPIPRLSSGNRLEETGSLDIKCHTKKTKLDNSCTDFHATHINLSSMASFEVKSYTLQKAATILTHLSKRKLIKILHEETFNQRMQRSWDFVRQSSQSISRTVNT